MSGLSFLRNAKLEETPVVKKGPGGKAKQWNPNPTILAVRLWKDGSVFPSQALVDQFNLDYKNATITKVALPLKEGQTEEEQKFKNEYYYVSGPGNGFDVIDSRQWPGFTADGASLFISPVERNQPKVDLFASVGYEEDGTPKTTVLEQGANTFGKSTLIEAVKEVYGIELGEDKEFVDLMVVDKIDDFDVVETFSKPVTFVPKIVVRGDDKGKADLQRRENAKIYLFAPASALGTTESEKEGVDSPDDAEANA